MHEAAAEAAMLGDLDLAARLAARTPAGFEVWPDNMAVAEAWLVVCTQWNATAMANGQVLFHGLNYRDVGEGLDRAEIKLSAAQWSGLRMMERVAAAALNGNRT